MKQVTQKKFFETETGGENRNGFFFSERKYSVNHSGSLDGVWRC